MQEKSKYIAAAIQFEPTLKEKSQNVQRLTALIEEAAAEGAQLITTPEMATTGYCWFNRAEAAPYVETIPGNTTDHFVELARRLDVHIVLGMPELDAETNLYYNSAVLIGPKGVVGTHRKTHPYIAEPKWSAPGNLGHQVFETPLGKIALLICMDIHFIETARLVGLGEADVICHISNWLAERTPAPYWISRALENACFLIESNRWGLERTVQFSGGSCIISPTGEVLDCIDNGDGYALATVDLQQARTRKVWSMPVFDERRPDLYTGLVSNAHTWNPMDYFRLYGHQPAPKGGTPRVSVAQFTPQPDTSENLERIEAFALAAAADGTDLLVLPELALTGPYRDGSAESRDGAAVSRLIKIAKKAGLYLVAGMAELSGEDLFNTAVLVGPEGGIGSYRKLHLGPNDHRWARAGDEWKFFDTPHGRIGLLIGHDAAYPEAGRVLALQGCDIIAWPAHLEAPLVSAHDGTDVAQSFPIPTGADPYHWHHMRVRSGENNLYVAFANSKGSSGVFGPDTFKFPRQEVIAVDDEELVGMEIDTSNRDSVYPTNVVKRKDLVMMRQPHHYVPLVKG